MSGMRRSMLMSSRVLNINVIAANTSLHDAEVIEGDSYSTQIVCDEGYSIYEITIKMGGTDITSTAFDPTYNMITIPSVTDDVDIECYAMHTMPSDYIRVDGIKNPSNAFMSTDYRMPAHSIAFVDCTRGNSNTAVGIFNSRPTGVTGTRSGGIVFNSGVISVGAWPDSATYFGYQSIGVTPAVGARFTVTLDKQNGKVLYNDVVKKTFTPNDTSTTDSSPMCLFAFEKWSAGNPGNSANYIIHFASIKEGNSYVRYYIPCLNDSGVAGFWDAARGVFQGSGNSTAFEAVTSPDTYVGGGKIFHLDGIEKGATADAWTNLVGNQVLTKQGDVEAIENGWRFPGTTDDYLVSPNQPILIGENITVEVCFKPESASGMVFGPNQRLANKAVFYKDGDRYLFQQDNYTYTYATTLGNKYTMSFSQGRGLVNMTSIAKDATTGFVTFAVNNYMFVGVRRTTTAYYVPFKGEIYSIRVYNRQLTEAEVLHNQKIDNIRFNLGLTT